MSEENNILDLSEASIRIAELEYKLQEATELISAIRHGEVDALLLNKNGKPDVYSLESIDYTFRILVEKFAEGALSISKEGVIQYCNSYFSQLIDIPINKIIGSHLGSYLSSMEVFKTLLKSIENGVYKGEIIMQVKEKIIPVYISITSLEPNLPGYGIILNDLTDKRKSEKLIINFQKKLEARKIAKIKAEAATIIAEKAVKAKQQFLANMSHEIRTPMNAIVGFTNVVLKTPLTKDQKEYITAIKDSGDALIILINDILDLAKVNAGKMSFEKSPFNLSISISAMLQLFEAKFKEKNLELIKKYDENIPETLIGDAMRLRQIILNLLSNALKFTSQGSITVSVQLLKEDSKKVSLEFEITDTGIGIPEDRLGQIFNNFEQAHIDTSNSYGGTGLGLAIVKQLIEMQGGNVFVRSKYGDGSTFGFVLSFDKIQTVTPGIEKEALPAVAEKISTEKPLNNIKVLVAEDVTLNQLLIKIIIADFGFELDIADNGKIAIEKLKENTYDIILMDLQMPEMNGFEATAYIRKEMKSNIPIIALTADVTSIDVKNCKNIGMNDFISKPIDESLLYSKMINQLKKHHQ